MSESREQLVRRITERVLAALDAAGAAPEAPADGRGGPGEHRGTGAQPAPHADIRPPIGVCTGDYSQFPEMRGRLGSAAAVPAAGSGAEPVARTAAPSPAVADERAPMALAGIVTARRLPRSRGAVVYLDAGARLTPLAADIVKERRLSIERVNGAGGAAPLAKAASWLWLWWIDGHCPAVERLGGELRSALVPAMHRRRPSELATVVRDLARRAGRGGAAGGLLFVHSAAQAACFANRCPSLRAVVGTCGQAVEEGVRLLGANVRIVEYPHHGAAAMRRMVDQFICTPRPPLPEVDRRLKELSRCV